MQPVAIHVMHSVVCVSVCWAQGRTLQKRLNRSRCCLAADSCGPKEPCIRLGSRLDKPISHHEVWQDDDAVFHPNVFITTLVYIYTAVCI